MGRVGLALRAGEGWGEWWGLVALADIAKGESLQVERLTKRHAPRAQRMEKVGLLLRVERIGGMVRVGRLRDKPNRMIAGGQVQRLINGVRCAHGLRDYGFLPTQE
jgi:hypothetical protein